MIYCTIKYFRDVYCEIDYVIYEFIHLMFIHTCKWFTYDDSIGIKTCITCEKEYEIHY